MITYAEFEGMELRAARITSAEPIPGKSRIMRGVIDVGDAGTRDVVIGGAEHYSPEEMVGRMVVVVANLEPRMVAGIESCAMLLAADVDGRPVWLSADGAPPGSRVM